MKKWWEKEREKNDENAIDLYQQYKILCWYYVWWTTTTDDHFQWSILLSKPLDITYNRRNSGAIKISTFFIYEHRFSHTHARSYEWAISYENTNNLMYVFMFIQSICVVSVSKIKSAKTMCLLNAEFCKYSSDADRNRFFVRCLCNIAAKVFEGFSRHVLACVWIWMYAALRYNNNTDNFDFAINPMKIDFSLLIGAQTRAWILAEHGSGNKYFYDFSHEN